MGCGRKERGRQGRKEEDNKNIEYTQDQYLGTATQPAAFPQILSLSHNVFK